MIDITFTSHYPDDTQTMHIVHYTILDFLEEYNGMYDVWISEYTGESVHMQINII